MSDWQERITRETAPAVRVEHELRYRIASPLIASATVWADLGCGNGLAAAAALEGARPGRAVLVDLDAEAASLARSTLQLSDAAMLAGDLCDQSFLRRVGEALRAPGGDRAHGEPRESDRAGGDPVESDRVVTCFEVVEHLPSFVPLLRWAAQLAREGLATFVVSVPNDAFWSIQNPYHETAWGEGAFEELSRLLPEERTLLRQVGLTGSAVIDWAAPATSCQLTVGAGGPAAVATHFIAAFGHRHAEVLRCARAVQADQLGQRRWERERESNLAIAERVIAEQSQKLRENTAEFDAWRAYIHELERQLGRPPSGSEEAMAYAAKAPAAGEAAAPDSAADERLDE